MIPSQNWYNNLLKQSSIVDEEGLKLLVTWMIKPITEIVLKFKASSNEFKINKYFEECGDLTNTIVIVKTTKGKILGAFTPLTFNPPNHIWTCQEDSQPIKDESNSSFQFSLSEKAKFQLQKDSYAIRRWKDKKAIVFYNTFCINGNSNTQDQNGHYPNAFVLGYQNYNTSKYADNEQSYLKITGQTGPDFLAQQWQVYQVLFE